MKASRVKTLLAAAGIVVGSLTAAAPVALASTGNTSNGCTAQYFTTAFSSKCNPATASGNYQTHGACRWQSDIYAPKQYVGKNSIVNGVSSGECSNKVTGATVAFWG